MTLKLRVIFIKPLCHFSFQKGGMTCKWWGGFNTVFLRTFAVSAVIPWKKVPCQISWPIGENRVDDARSVFRTAFWAGHCTKRIDLKNEANVVQIGLCLRGDSWSRYQSGYLFSRYSGRYRERRQKRCLNGPIHCEFLLQLVFLSPCLWLHRMLH